MAEEIGVFVGREKELDLLERALHEMLQGRGQVAFLTGPAGSGVTTLARHFMGRARQAVPNLRAAYVECPGKSASMSVFLELDAAIRQSEHKSAWQDTLQDLKESARTAGPDAAKLIPIVGDPLGVVIAFFLDFFNRRREIRSKGEIAIHHDYIFQRVTDNFRSLTSTKRPLLMVADNWHRADAGSVEMLEYLAARIADVPLLFLAAYPSVPGQIADEEGPLRLWEKLRSKNLCECVKVDIGLFTRNDVQCYLAGVFPGVDYEAAFVDWIAERTEGNARFLAEYVKELQNGEDPILSPTGQILRDYRQAAIPHSMQELIQKRVERLGGEEKRTLSYASTEGEEFTTEFLPRLLEMSEMPLIDQLTEIEEVYRLIISLEERQGFEKRVTPYQFNPALAQQTLYHRLKPSQQRELNRRLLELKETLYSGFNDLTKSQMVGQLIDHAERAEDYLAAARYALESAQYAMRLHAHADVAEKCHRGLRALGKVAGSTPESAGLQIDLLLIRARMEDWTGSWEAAQRTWDEAERLAQNDLPRLARIHCRRAYSLYYYDPHPVEQAAPYFHRALAILEELKEAADPGDLAETYNGLGLVADAPDQEIEWYQKALALWEKMGRAGEFEIPIAYHNIGCVHERRGDYDQAMEWFQKSRVAHETILREEARALTGEEPQELRPELGLGTTYASIAGIHYEKGEYEAADRAIRTAIDIQQKTGSPSHLTGTYVLAGQIAQARGDQEQAERWFEQAIENEKKIYGEPGIAGAYNEIAFSFSNHRKYVPALEWFEKVLAAYKEAGDNTKVAGTYFWIGNAYQEWGKYDLALENYYQASVLFDAGDNIEDRANTYYRLGSVSSSLNEHARAKAWYQRALPLYQELGSRTMQASVCHNIGYADQNLREHQSAQEWFEKSIALQEQSSPYLSLTYSLLAKVHAAQHAYGQALACYQKTFELQEEAQDLAGAASTAIGIGVIYRDQEEDNAQTLYWYRRAADLFKRLDKPYELAATYYNMGSICDMENDDTTALEWYHLAQSIQERVGAQEDLAITCYMIGQIYHNRGTSQQAIAEYTKAVNANPEYPYSYMRRGEIYLALGERDKALTDFHRYIELLPEQRWEVLNRIGELEK